MGSHGPITPTTIRALLAIQAGRPLVRGEHIAARRARNWSTPLLTWSDTSAGGWDLTLAGELVLAAYRLGRSRWGAHG